MRMQRRSFVSRVAASAAAWSLLGEFSRADEEAPGYRLQLDTIHRGYDGQTCWVHARAGTIPGETPAVVLTMQRLQVTGSDLFHPLNDMRTDDLGRTWQGPVEQAETLGRTTEPDGTILGVCDFWPKYHRASGKLLGIGHTVRYRNNKVVPNRQRETAWSVYDPEARTWSRWQALVMPAEEKYFNCGAGCVQRLDRPNGDILLPVHYRAATEPRYTTAVLRCRFDGQSLTLVEPGSEHTVEIGRGLYEPSLTRFRDRYYLTLRNDSTGYVAASDDGLHFSPAQPWCWDDGTNLGNYNTQQHWVTHSNGLFLVYTRRGANNDHVFRHRAPLFMAQVDPVTLRIRRDTERIVVPERGARLGNFGVTIVSPEETWVTVTEWMQKAGPDVIIPPHNPHGADNSVYVSRILWAEPNKVWDQL